MRTQQPVIVPDVLEVDPDLMLPDWLSEEDFRGHAVVPLIANQRTAGVMLLNTREPRPDDDGATRFLQLLANQAAIALETARLHEEERERWRLADQLAALGQVSVLDADPGEEVPRYTILQVEADPAIWQGAAGPSRIVFDDALEVWPLSPLLGVASPGETLEFTLAMRALEPLPTAYNLFVHLYGDPTPYEGGPLWAQADDPLCAPYPADRWQPGEVIVQQFNLQIPSDAPPGPYRLALGVYDSDPAVVGRLLVTFPALGQDWASLAAVVVARSGYWR